MSMQCFTIFGNLYVYLLLDFLHWNATILSACHLYAYKISMAASPAVWSLPRAIVVPLISITFRLDVSASTSLTGGRGASKPWETKCCLTLGFACRLRVCGVANIILTLRHLEWWHWQLARLKRHTLAQKKTIFCVNILNFSLDFRYSRAVYTYSHVMHA